MTNEASPCQSSNSTYQASHPIQDHASFRGWHYEKSQSANAGWCCNCGKSPCFDLSCAAVDARAAGYANLERSFASRQTRLPANFASGVGTTFLEQSTTSVQRESPVNFASSVELLSPTDDMNLDLQHTNPGYPSPANLDTCLEISKPGTRAALVGLPIHVRSSLDYEDQLLVHLRVDLGKEWRESAAIFSEHVGRTHSVPALQMRYQRLQKKIRQWDSEDVLLLRRAHAFWKTHKWDFISQKMSELAATDLGTSSPDSCWSAKRCAEKWQSLLFELGSL